MGRHFRSGRSQQKKVLCHAYKKPNVILDFSFIKTFMNKDSFCKKEKQCFDEISFI